MNILIKDIYRVLFNSSKYLMSGLDKTFVAIWLNEHKCKDCIKVVALLRRI